MILCLFGTNPYEFSRLAVELDKIAKNLGKSFFVQRGYTQYDFANCDYFDFMEKERLFAHINAAELIISQGGYGSLSDSVFLGKKIIAVPRYIKLNESKDDQVELVKFYEEKKYIVACYDVGFLEQQVRDVLSNKYFFNKYMNYSGKLIRDHVKSYISKL